MEKTKILCYTTHSEVGMSEINVEIESIVKNIGKDISFLQPAYEAIVNSIEANATIIDVEFFIDNQITMKTFQNKISSYQITDNGDGFTKDNIDSFNKLWSSHKVQLGCKGSGRFTWLKVFNNISIVSELSEPSKKVLINFSKNYDLNKNLFIENKNIIENKTTIIFNNCVFPIVKGTKTIDERENADIEVIYTKILDYLLVKLFLLKKNGKDFTINIKMGGVVKTITNSDILDLLCKTFSVETKVPSDRYGDKIDFTVYYKFTSDRKRSKKAYYCAHERIVKRIDDDSLGFSASLPNNDSMIVLLCSQYFDDNVNDQRDGFHGLENSDMKSRNASYPILLSDIKYELKKHINQIIKENYPSILDINKKIIASAINETPYLSKYIYENTDILISKDSLIKEAKNEFEKSKEKARKKFDKILENVDINTDALNLSITEVSEIASAELGEYMLYREKIIKALALSLSNKDKNEKYVHNIFMPKNTSATEFDEDKKMLNNLWLLDDKYMAYSFVASDKKIEDIYKAIEEENKKRNIFMGNKKPDITILFNKEKNKDVVVIEFKKPFATLGEKETAPTEVNRNIGIIKRTLTDVNSIYGYIITEIDEEFNQSLKDNGYIELFSTSIDGKILYAYNKTNNAHIFAIDLKSIVSDAEARNQTFLDILKDKTKKDD